MNKFDRRWLAVKKLFETINKHIEEDGAVIEFDGQISHYLFEIDDLNREVYQSFANCIIVLYNGDSEYDEGAHTPLKEWRKDFLSRLRVYKEIRLEL